MAATSLPVLQPTRLRDDQAGAQIRALAPDVTVVMAYGQILPQSVLEIPRIASLNLHASLLPQYRGAAPIQAAIAAGDAETGITVIYMDAGLDTGDILPQSRLAISPNETGGSLHDRLAQLAPDTLLTALAQLAAGRAARLPQDSARATYAAKLTRDDGKIDWSEPAEVIERKIRAFDPWPGAFTSLADASGNSRHLKIDNPVQPDDHPETGKDLRMVFQRQAGIAKEPLRIPNRIESPKNVVDPGNDKDCAMNFSPC